MLRIICFSLIVGQVLAFYYDMDLADFVSSAVTGTEVIGAETDALLSAASMAGDVNGDGLNDFIVGAPGMNNGTGAAYVIFGQRDGVSLDLQDFVSGSTGFAIFGASAGDGAGYSVSGAGDVNDDGFHDVIFTAPNASGFGAAYVIFGHNGSLHTFLDIQLSTFESSHVTGFVIRCDNETRISEVSAAGDVNSDGIADILVAAPRAT